MKSHIISLFLFLCLTSPTHAQQSPTRNAPPVVIQQVALEEFVDRIESIGTLRANETTTLASTVTETVTAVNFTDGQRVKKGDVLIEMTSAEEKALIEQQKSLVQEAWKQLERVKSLSREGAASAALLDQRQREYTSAVTGMLALQSRLNDHIIVAPFDGVLGLRNISVGALLQPGTKITTLDDDSVMKLDFSVPSIFLPSLKPGLEIVAKAAGYKEEFKGIVTAIDSQINEDTRAITVRSLIQNPGQNLKPGLLMTVTLLKDPRQSIAIPEDAIIPEGRKAFVLVVSPKDNPPIAEKREIITGLRRPGKIEVTTNLSAGEHVIVQGTMVARPGQPVTIQAVRKDGETVHEVLSKTTGAAPLKKE